MDRPRIVFMGTPDFAAVALRYLVADGCEVAAVYTQQDQSAGRGRVLVPGPVKKAACELGLPIIQPRHFKNEQITAELAGLKPDVVVVVAYGQILPRTVLDIPRHGCINIHPSLLPRFRGVSPVPAAILAGDEFTGVTVMLLDAGTDTGPVLAQAEVPISTSDTSGSLSNKLARLGPQLLLDVLPLWVKGMIDPLPQDASIASYCRKLNKADGEIDFRVPAVDIWRRVRAFNPWPGAFTGWQGRQFKILEATPLPAIAGLAPGQVVELRDKGIGVCTGEGVLGLLTVQQGGKRAMPAGDFLRGQRQMLGAVLGRQ